MLPLLPVPPLLLPRPLLLLLAGPECLLGLRPVRPGEAESTVVMWRLVAKVWADGTYTQPRQRAKHILCRLMLVFVCAVRGRGGTWLSWWGEVDCCQVAMDGNSQGKKDACNQQLSINMRQHMQTPMHASQHTPGNGVA